MVGGGENGIEAQTGEGWQVLLANGKCTGSDLAVLYTENVKGSGQYLYKILVELQNCVLH